MEIVVANGHHNGVVRVHTDTYLNPTAQAAIDEIVGKNKDLSDAILIAEHQVIVLEAATPQHDADRLKKIARSFNAAVANWYDQLDQLEHNMISYHPNIVREALEAYSTTGPSQPRFDSMNG